MHFIRSVHLRSDTSLCNVIIIEAYFISWVELCCSYETEHHITLSPSADGHLYTVLWTSRWHLKLRLKGRVASDVLQRYLMVDWCLRQSCSFVVSVELLGDFEVCNMIHTQTLIWMCTYKTIRLFLCKRPGEMCKCVWGSEEENNKSKLVCV